MVLLFFRYLVAEVIWTHLQAGELQPIRFSCEHALIPIDKVMNMAYTDSRSVIHS